MQAKGKAPKVPVAAKAGAGCRHSRGETGRKPRVTGPFTGQSLTTQWVKSPHLFLMAARPQPLCLPALKDGVSRGEN